MKFETLLHALEHTILQSDLSPKEKFTTLQARDELMELMHSNDLRTLDADAIMSHDIVTMSIWTFREIIYDKAYDVYGRIKVDHGGTITSDIFVDSCIKDNLLPLTDSQLYEIYDYIDEMYSAIGQNKSDGTYCDTKDRLIRILYNNLTQCLFRETTKEQLRDDLGLNTHADTQLRETLDAALGHSWEDWTE